MSARKTIPFPDHVRPLGIPFQVQLVDEIDEGASVGETAVDLRLIKITADQDTRRRWTTLLHEYIHATLGIVGIHSVVPNEVEEVVVQSLEHSLEQFMMAHGAEFLRALEVQKDD